MSCVAIDCADGAGSRASLYCEGEAEHQPPAPSKRTSRAVFVYRYLSARRRGGCSGQPCSRVDVGCPATAATCPRSQFQLLLSRNQATLLRRCCCFQPTTARNHLGLVLQTADFRLRQIAPRRPLTTEPWRVVRAERGVPPVLRETLNRWPNNSRSDRAGCTYPARQRRKKQG